MVKLSIVIPYYKTYELTDKLLTQLCKQLTDEVEVFVVDDGCNETRLDKYSEKINIDHLEKNVGSTSAMNKQLSKTKGKYIAIIDSDDMITDDYISTLLHNIDTRKEDVLFFNWQDMNTKEIVEHPCNYAPWKAIYKKEIMPRFRDGWIYSYDVPFQADLDKTNYSRYYIDKVLYLYNSKRPGNLTLEKERIIKENMFKCEVIEQFTLSKYDELKDIERKARSEKGKLFVGDRFKCSQELAKYLLGGNHLKRPFVRIIETAPEKSEKKTTKTSKKIDKRKEK